jgi:hypothetical protein
LIFQKGFLAFDFFAGVDLLRDFLAFDRLREAFRDLERFGDFFCDVSASPSG